jgi:hypothetical protein
MATNDKRPIVKLRSTEGVAAADLRPGDTLDRDGTHWQITDVHHLRNGDVNLLVRRFSCKGCRARLASISPETYHSSAPSLRLGSVTSATAGACTWMPTTR